MHETLVGARVGLGDVVGAFKSLATTGYIGGVNAKGWPEFRDRLWQRNYHEHIIRDEDALHRVRQYICDNPSLWSGDRDNPQAIAMEPKDAWRA